MGSKFMLSATMQRLIEIADCRRACFKVKRTQRNKELYCNVTHTGLDMTNASSPKKYRDAIESSREVVFCPIGHRG